MSRTVRSTNCGSSPEALAAIAQPLISRLSRLIRRRTPGGIPAAQVSALSSLDQHGPLPLGQLARLESVTPQTMTMVVRRLVDAGLADRQALDGRSAIVDLTAAGRDALTRARQEATEYLEARISDLDEDERAQLAIGLSILSRLADS